MPPAVPSAKAPAKGAAAAPPPKVQKFKVRATRMGFHEHARRREGDVFVYHLPEGQELPSWVELVPKSTPERFTSAQDAIKQAHDELLAAKAGSRRDEEDVEGL